MTLSDNAPVLYDRAPVRHSENHRHVLFHDQDREPVFPIDPGEDLRDLRHKNGHDAVGRFVEKHRLGMHHEPAADRQHLLLAAAHRARLLIETLGQTGEVAQDFIEGGWALPAATPNRPISRFSLTVRPGNIPRP